MTNHPILKNNGKLFYMKKMEYFDDVPFRSLEQGNVYLGFKDNRGYVITPNDDTPMGIIFPELTGENHFSEYEIVEVDDNFLFDYMDELSEDVQDRVTQFFEDKQLVEETKKSKKPDKKYDSGDIEIQGDIPPDLKDAITEKAGEIMEKMNTAEGNLEMVYPRFYNLLEDTVAYMQFNSYLPKVDDNSDMMTPDSFVQLLRDFYWDYNERGRKFAPSDLKRLLARMIITLDNIYE
jgi:hypothetical protein